MGELTQEAEQAAINASRDMGRNGVKFVAFVGRIVFNFVGGVTEQTRYTIADGIAKKRQEAIDNNPYYPEKIPKDQAKIDIDLIKSQGRMQRIDESMSKELMSYFDKYCKEMNVKYAILENKEENNFSVFFNGPDAAMIDHALSKGIKDYEKEKISSRREKLRIDGIEDSINKTFKDGVTFRKGKGEIVHLTNKDLINIAIKKDLKADDKDFIIKLKKEASKEMGLKKNRAKKKKILKTKGFLDGFQGSLLEALKSKNEKSIKDNEGKSHEKSKRKNEQTR